MITITGQTFAHKETFRRWRGRWSPELPGWVFDHLTASQKAEARALVGCLVAEMADPEPVWSMPDEDDTPISFDALSVVTTNRQGPVAFYGDDPSQMGVYKHNCAAFFGFSSLGAFTEYIDRMPVHKQRYSGWEDGEVNFTGTETMREAIDLALVGWSEGAELAEEISERMTLERPRVKKRSKALAGGAVNVGRMLSGDPKHMIRRPKQPGSKVITLYVEAGYNGYISTVNACIRAAMIAAMVDIMENNGYSCSIIAVDLSFHGLTPLYQLSVQLKEAGERLNLSDVVFGLGHPSFLRRMSFAACSSERETREIWASQGSSGNSFDIEHRCNHNSFHIPTFTHQMQSAMTDDYMKLLPWLIPDGLPLEIGE